MGHDRQYCEYRRPEAVDIEEVDRILAPPTHKCYPVPRVPAVQVVNLVLPAAYELTRQPWVWHGVAEVPVSRQERDLHALRQVVEDFHDRLDWAAAFVTWSKSPGES